MRNKKITYKEITYKIAPIIFTIDQIIKIIVNHSLNIHEEITIIPKFFSIHYVKNTGAAFSMMEDSTLLLVIISSLFLVIINRYVKKEKNITKSECLFFGMIMGGVLGNLIDRIIHGGVIDYLSFTLFGHGFAIFNFADACIVLGVLLFAASTFLGEKVKLKITKAEEN